MRCTSPQRDARRLLERALLLVRHGVGRAGVADLATTMLVRAGRPAAIERLKVEKSRR